MPTMRKGSQVNVELENTTFANRARLVRTPIAERHTPHVYIMPAAAISISRDGFPGHALVITGLHSSPACLLACLLA